MLPQSATRLAGERVALRRELASDHFLAALTGLAGVRPRDEGQMRNLDVGSAVDVVPNGAPTMTKHVLLVDDDPAMRDVVGNYLESHNFRVSLAADGRMM